MSRVCPNAPKKPNAGSFLARVMEITPPAVPHKPNAGSALASFRQNLPPKKFGSVKRNIDFEDLYEIDPVVLFEEPAQKRPKIEV